VAMDAASHGSDGAEGGAGYIGKGNSPIKCHFRTIRPQSRIKKLY
jgi:hypothetical protein